MGVPDQALDTYASKIIAEIKHDISTGIVPAQVASFGELHDCVGANDCTAQFIPEDVTPDWDA